MIIIGNGFDLFNDLKSSFTDFIYNKYSTLNDVINNIFKDRTFMDTLTQDLFTQNFYFNFIDDSNDYFSFSDKLSIDEKKNIEQKVQTNLKEDYVNSINILNGIITKIGDNPGCFNFWAAYFLMIKQDQTIKITNWNDVEKLIQEYIYRTYEDESSGLGMLLSLFSSYLQINEYNSELSFEDENIEIKRINSLLITMARVYSKEINILIKSLLIKSSHGETIHLDTLKISILDFLQNQLIAFEEEFNNYMYETVKNNNEYNEKSFKTLKLLSSNNYSLLLNFNYTNPKMPLKIKNSNIHGEIIMPKNFNNYNNNIIIGIDSENLELDSPKYQFTKMFKIMKSNNKLNNDIFKRQISINEIIFFGHSLGLADYAYFKRIFDIYEVYKGIDCNIKLTFYYANHDGIPEYKLAGTQIKNVMNLLNKYLDDHNDDVYDKNKFIQDIFWSNKLKVKNISSKNN